jgi:crotonobetainyl-CoA:carnitine CoA-transferase CaiB-like acyl-CoA transferase
MRTSAGLRVVELSTDFAVEAAAGVLAGWGVDVVKVEPKGGVPMR